MTVFTHNGELIKKRPVSSFYAAIIVVESWSKAHENVTINYNKKKKLLVSIPVISKCWKVNGVWRIM